MIFILTELVFLHINFIVPIAFILNSIKIVKVGSSLLITSIIQYHHGGLLTHEMKLVPLLLGVTTKVVA